MRRVFQVLVIVFSFVGAAQVASALKDPEFVADAKKSRLNIDPIPVDTIEKDIAGLFKLDPSLVAKLKDVLYN